jgi:hypothetical protein
MSETVYKCKCPICGEYTNGNKRIGLYDCKLTGRGLKAPKVVISEQVTQNTEDTDDSDDEKGHSIQEK